MQVTIALLADAANATEDGRLNILGVFNQLKAPRFPATHPSCVLVIQLRARPSESGETVKLSIKLMDSDSVITQIDGDLTVPTTFAMQGVNLNQLMQLQMLPIAHAGSYAFHVLVNGTEMATVPFEAILVEQPPSP